MRKDRPGMKGRGRLVIDAYHKPSYSLILRTNLARFMIAGLKSFQSEAFKTALEAGELTEFKPSIMRAHAD
jgi:hypothetical protein